MTIFNLSTTTAPATTQQSFVVNEFYWTLWKIFNHQCNDWIELNCCSYFFLSLRFISFWLFAWFSLVVLFYSCVIMCNFPAWWVSELVLAIHINIKYHITIQNFESISYYHWNLRLNKIKWTALFSLKSKLSALRFCSFKWICMDL